jgi:serine/threonine-protein kinase HipA
LTDTLASQLLGLFSLVEARNLLPEFNHLLAFAKATGSFDEIDRLSVVERSQIGRIRFTGMEDELDEAVPFQSVDEILTNRRSGDLYRYLIERFAS